MTMIAGNLFANVVHKSDGEQVTELLSTGGARIERIVSTGHASPPDYWYDQDWAEWILLLAGSAGLLFDGEDAPRLLKPGDYICIDAHRRHRVAWTDSTQPTVWLAIHLREPAMRH
jgi:cupin 2 domain-containing protein